MANREIRNSNVRKIIHRYISKVYSECTWNPLELLELICVNDNFLNLYSKNYYKQCWNQKKH